jgi:hypothetical protein
MIQDVKIGTLPNTKKSMQLSQMFKSSLVENLASPTAFLSGAQATQTAHNQQEVAFVNIMEPTALTYILLLLTPTSSRNSTMTKKEKSSITLFSIKYMDDLIVN